MVSQGIHMVYTSFLQKRFNRVLSIEQCTKNEKITPEFSINSLQCHSNDK